MSTHANEERRLTAEVYRDLDDRLRSVQAQTNHMIIVGAVAFVITVFVLLLINRRLASCAPRGSSTPSSKTD